MLARDEIRVSMGLLLVVQLATSFGAIGLLTRMGPAIGQILQENMVSIQATEAMLAALASEEGTVTERRVAFQQALTQAERNITIESERPVLKKIQEHSGAAFDGDAGARATLIIDLRELSHVNQASMEEADQRARRLGTAGAWAAILLGLTGFMLSLIIFRRMQDRLLSPVQDIHDVLVAFDGGDTLRRTSIHRAPSEITVIGQHLNAMLDTHGDCQVAPWTEIASQDRALLLALLDARAGAALLFDAAGALHAANDDALNLDQTQRDRLSAAIRAGSADVEGWTLQPLGPAGWLATRTS